MSKKYLDRVIAFTMAIVLVLSLIAIDNRFSSVAESDNSNSVATETDGGNAQFFYETEPEFSLSEDYSESSYYNSLDGLVSVTADKAISSASIEVIGYDYNYDEDTQEEIETIYTIKKYEITDLDEDTLSYEFTDVDEILEALEEGENFLRFIATSSTETAEQYITFNYDSVDPEIAITDEDGEEISSSLVTTEAVDVTISFSDETSGIDLAKTSITINGEAQTLSDTYTNTFTFDSNGSYTINVSTADKAGNTSTASVVVKVDMDSLETSLVLVTDGSSQDGTGTIYTNAASAIATYVVTGYAIDADDVTATVTKTSTSGTSTEVSVTPSVETDSEGYVTLTYTYALSANFTYKFSMSAHKHYDVSDVTTNSMTVVYDTEGPSASITFNNYETYLNGVYYYSSTPSITVIGEDNYSLSSYTVTDGSGTVVASGTMSGTSASKTISLSSGISNNTLYTIVLTISDSYGNSTTSSAYKFIIDTVSPTVTASVGSYYNNGSTTVSVSASDNFYVTSIKAVATCDGKAVADQTATISSSSSASTTFTYSAEGTYAVTIYAYDEAGNCATTTTSFKIDSTAPKARISGVPSNNLSTGTTVTVTVTDDAAIDPSMFVVTLYYRCYDELTYSSRTLTLTQDSVTKLTASVKCNEINSKPAQYYITVTGKDQSGNDVSYDVETSRLKVDSTPPEIEFTSDPEETNDGYYNSAVTATFVVREQFTNKTKITVSDAYKSTNGDENETYTQKGLEVSYKIKRSTEGKYKITVTAEDAFGNEDSETIEFVIDKTNPTITLSSVNSINNSNVSLNVTLDDNFKGEDYSVHVIRKDANGAVVYDAVMDSGTWASTSKTLQYAFTEEGDYEVTVTANDKAGNAAESKTVSFRIDKTAPVLSITGVEDTQTTACTATMSMAEAFDSIYGTATLDNTSITAIITKKVDGSGETTIATLNASDFSSGSTRTATYNFSEDGEYTITFSATDLAGNVAATVTKTFIVDKTAPELTVIAVNSASNNVSSYQVIGSSDAEDADYVEMTIQIVETFFTTNNVSIVVKKDGVDVSSQYFASFKSMSTTSKASQLFSEDGVYTIEISAVDALGNAAESYSLVFTIDNTAPTVDATSVLTSFQGKAILNATDFADIINSGYDALWTVNDTSVFDVVVKLDGVDFVDFSDLTDGYHTMTITVTDEVGHVTTDEFSFSYDGTAPRIIISGIDDGDTTYEAFTLSISLEDDEDTITKIAINGEEVASSLYESTNSYQFQVTDYGTYNIVVTATDEAGNVASTYDDETGTTFTFKYASKTTMVIYLIIIGISVLLILILLIILIARKRKNKK